MKEMKVLTICGAGVGTSMLLKINVEEVFNSLNLDFKIVLQNVSLSRAKTVKADLILVSETFGNINNDLDCDVITIVNLIDKKEIKKKIISYLKYKKLI